MVSVPNTTHLAGCDGCSTEAEKAEVEYWWLRATGVGPMAVMALRHLDRLAGTTRARCTCQSR